MKLFNNIRHYVLCLALAAQLATPAFSQSNYWWWLNSGFKPSTEYKAVLTEATEEGYTLPPKPIQRDQNIFLNEIASIRAKIDILYLFATNSGTTEAFSKINLVNPTGTKATFGTTGAGNITYSNQGVLGNTGGAYIDTGINTSSTVNYTLNSAFEGFFVWKKFVSSNVLSGNVTATSCTVRNDNTTAQRLNSGGNVTGAIDLSGLGFKALNRSSVNDLQAYADKVRTDKTIGSFALPNETRKIYRQGASYGDAGIAAYILGGSLTESEKTTLRNALNKYITNIYLKLYTSGDIINVYLLGPPAQSNLTGRGVNTQAALELQGTVGAMVYHLLPTPPGTINNTSQFEVLEMGVNNTTESLGTQHGMEMRFGYNMYQVFPNTYIIKFGIGGTSMASSWNKNGSAYRAYIETIMLELALPYLRYTLKKPFVIRGVIAFQGESDCSGGLGAAYKASYEAMILDFLDRLNNAGYKTDKLRWCDFIPKYSAAAGYTETDYNNVESAKITLMDSLVIRNPSYSGSIKSTKWFTTNDVPRQDNEHVNAVGLDTLATRVYNYLYQYRLE